MRKLTECVVEYVKDFGDPVMREYHILGIGVVILSITAVLGIVGIVLRAIGV